MNIRLTNFNIKMKNFPCDQVLQLLNYSFQNININNQSTIITISLSRTMNNNYK